ncbi:hypothetical protein VTG60DRAFT_697 [Thermothelomyces hinnuleus]
MPTCLLVGTELIPSRCLLACRDMWTRSTFYPSHFVHLLSRARGCRCRLRVHIEQLQPEVVETIADAFGCGFASLHAVTPAESISIPSESATNFFGFGDGHRQSSKGCSSQSRLFFLSFFFFRLSFLSLFAVSPSISRGLVSLAFPLNSRRSAEESRNRTVITCRGLPFAFLLSCLQPLHLHSKPVNLF